MEDGTREKRRISVRIAGRTLSLVTEEDEADVRRIERELDDRIDGLCRSSPRLATREGKLDAVLLCAIDALDREIRARRDAEEKEKALDEAEKRVRALSAESARLAARLETAAAGRRDPRSREEKIAVCLGRIGKERRRSREEGNQ